MPLGLRNKLVREHIPLVTLEGLELVVSQRGTGVFEQDVKMRPYAQMCKSENSYPASDTFFRSDVPFAHMKGRAFEAAIVTAHAGAWLS